MNNKIKILVNKMPTHPSECRFAYQLRYIGETPKYETWYCKANHDTTCGLLCPKKECDCLMTISELGGVNSASE